MSCNGWNHSKDCVCNFAGRQHGNEAPRWRGWSFKQAKRYARQPNANCYRCGAPIYYICAQSGGGEYFEKLGAPWTKHACVDPQVNKRYKHFVPSDDGWALMVVTTTRDFATGTFLRGLSLDDHSVLCFASKESLQIDRNRPMSFRRTLSGLVDVSYFQPEILDPVYGTMIDDCASPFELLSREAA